MCMYVGVLMCVHPKKNDTRNHIYRYDIKLRAKRIYQHEFEY